MFTAKLVVVPKTKQNKTWQYIQQIKWKSIRKLLNKCWYCQAVIYSASNKKKWNWSIPIWLSHDLKLCSWHVHVLNNKARSNHEWYKNDCLITVKLYIMKRLVVIKRNIYNSLEIIHDLIELNEHKQWNKWFGD